jgi:hypothetical protein
MKNILMILFSFSGSKHEGTVLSRVEFGLLGEEC